MKKLRIALIALVLLLLILLCWCWRFAHRGMPLIDGELALPGLQEEVEVVRDGYGIPHIFARNRKDLFFAVGFVHAQDRLWQMDLIRRISEGRLSEIFGDRPQSEHYAETASLLEEDKFKRLIGFEHIGRIGVKVLDPEIKSYFDSYCAGVNTYLKRNRGRLPVEFALLGYEPAPWTPEDMIAISRYLSWNLSFNWRQELFRYLVAARIGRERAVEVLGGAEGPGPYIIPPEVKKFPRGKGAPGSPRKGSEGTPGKGSPGLPEKGSPGRRRGSRQGCRGGIDVGDRALEALAGLLDLDRGGGIAPPPLPASNSWVVAGGRSASGLPILANDPHLVHLLPSIFYAVHMKAGEFEVSGVSFPGLPFVTVGHNRHIAWGATTNRADVQDLYMEKVNPSHPGKYLYRGEWRPFQRRTEVIRVKEEGGFREVPFEVLSTVHGPVLNACVAEMPADAPPIALKWTGLEPTDEAAAYLGLAEAKGMADFRAATEKMAVPITNWIFADDRGNIGYTQPGRIPIREGGDRRFPVEGWTGKHEWEGYIPPGELPQLYNPERGYIVTANNKVVPPDGYPYFLSEEYAPTYRAARIEALLKAKKTFTPGDMKRIQVDDHSMQGERLCRYIIAAAEGKAKAEGIYGGALAELKGWDFRAHTGSVGATLFYRTYAEALRRVLEDDIGPSLFRRFLKLRRLENSFDNLLEKGESPLFDDRRTEAVEGREEILARSFEDAVDSLKAMFGEDVSRWTWGRIHTLEFRHAFGASRILAPFFCLGPFPRAGGRHVVNMSFYPPGEKRFRSFGGAPLRFVIDMARPDRFEMVLDTGQSGHFLSRHYDDQMTHWLRGETLPLLMDPEAVKKGYEGTLILKPD
jgi:penicillin amidase